MRKPTLLRAILRPKLAVGCVDIGYPERRMIREVLDSGWVSPGPKVEEFESRFASLHDRSYGVMVNSGTDALRIALATLKEVHGWMDGDEVIVPALTFVATVNIILQNNLKPVFVDIERHTLNLDPTKIAAARTRRTRAIIPVHMFGLMADMYQIQAASPGLKIIEDSCETMGTRFLGDTEGNIGFGRNQKVGTFGEIACFSTYACHLIVTGVGGIAITENPEYDRIMRSYANHGRDPFFLGGYSQNHREPSLELIQKRFLYHRVGYSSRVSEFEAALGIGQLHRLPLILEKRNKNATLLERFLCPAKWNGVDGALQLPPVIPVNRTHAFMMFPIVIQDPAIDRDQFCLYLEENGIETRPLMPLLTQPVYKSTLGKTAKEFPIAYHATTRGFYVGCHPQMDQDDIRYMADQILNGVQKFSSKEMHAAA